MLSKILTLIFVIVAITLPLMSVKYFDYNTDASVHQIISWLFICFFYGAGVGHLLGTLIKEK